MPAPGLARVDRGADAERGGVGALGARDLREVEPVGRRADEGGGAEIPDRVEPRRGVLAASRDGQRAEDPRALEPGPEADEEAEREREEERGRSAPAPRPGTRRPSSAPTTSTTLRSRASGSAGPWCPTSGTRARSARAGACGSCRTAGAPPDRRPARAFVRRGKPGEVRPGADVARVPHAGGLETSAPEGVRAPDLAHPRGEPLPLPPREGARGAPSPARGRGTGRRLPRRDRSRPGTSPRGAPHGKRELARHHDDPLPADADTGRAAGDAVDLDGDPPRPALEVSLLSPEPRHAVGGGEAAGLPEPHADGRVRGARSRRPPGSRSAG